MKITTLNLVATGSRYLCVQHRLANRNWNILQFHVTQMGVSEKILRCRTVWRRWETDDTQCTHFSCGGLYGTGTLTVDGLSDEDRLNQTSYWTAIWQLQQAGWINRKWTLEVFVLLKFVTTYWYPPFFNNHLFRDQEILLFHSGTCLVTLQRTRLVIHLKTDSLSVSEMW